jgi:hypothetical protein
MTEQLFSLQDILRQQAMARPHTGRKGRYEVSLIDIEGKGQTNARTIFANGQNVDIPAHRRFVKAANESEAWRVAAHVVFERFPEVSCLGFHEVGTRTLSKLEGKPTVHQVESPDLLNHYRLGDDGRIDRLQDHEASGR